MKSLINTQKIESRVRAAQFLTYGGLIVLLGGIWLQFQRPDLGFDSGPLSFALLAVGFVASNTGIFLANRWLKRPRPEDILDIGLKPLPGDARLYHYLLPADHVLLTAQGVVVLEVVPLDGKFTYREGKWHQKFNLSRTLRLIVEQQLGDPIVRAKASAARIARLLDLPEAEPAPPVTPVVVFTSPLADLEVDDPPITVAGGQKLSKRLALGDKKLPAEVYNQFRDALDEAAGLD